MEVIHTTPEMVATASKGGKKFWRGEVLEMDGAFYTRTVSWHETQSGLSKAVESEPKLILGKNIGKANETTPREQAIKEVEALYLKQMQKGYAGPGDVPVTEFRPLPMLAQKWTERAKYITFPCAVQPKLDGIRMLFNGIDGWSRLGNEFDPRILKHLTLDAQGCVLDGELMLPSPYTFQQTTSAVKKWDPELSPKLVYHVYDVVEPGMSFKDRAQLCGEVITQAKNPSVVGVMTQNVKDEAELRYLHATFTELGFEGTMVRNWAGKYKLKDRSNDLQKFKDFVDEEFTIIDVVDGEAKEKGCAIFVFETKNGRTFSARPRGTVEQRRIWFEERQSIIGQRVTIRYQNLTDEGVPRFPVAIAIRDYE